MFAQARQVHHEGVFKLPVHLLLHGLEVAVAGTFFKLAAQQFFPVWPPDHFVHPLTVNQRTRASSRDMFAFRCAMQMFVVEGERFVVIINLRHHRVGEDFGYYAHLAAQTRAYLAIHIADPAALPLFLIFPVFRITNARFGFDVVKPCVLHAFASGPDVFTGHRTGMAADTFIEIKHHADLRTDFHFFASCT